MTTTMPPHAPGSRRFVPRAPEPDVADRLRRLLWQDAWWVLRPQWEAYLRTGREDLAVSTTRLTRDQLVAIHAWLRQQRHPLYQAVEGGSLVPDGWIEKLPLYTCVRDAANLAY
jgi:hypothetical protein